MNTEEYKYRLQIECAKEANATSIVPVEYSKHFPKSRNEQDKLFSEILDNVFKQYNVAYGYHLNKVAYLCADPLNRRAIKTPEICGMYIQKLLGSAVTGDENWTRTINAYANQLLAITHARFTYWNHSEAKLEEIIMNTANLVEIRIVALQYLYGVSEDLHMEMPNYKVRPGTPEKWAEVSHKLAAGNNNMDYIIDLGLEFYRKPAMIGISLLTL